MTKRSLTQLEKEFICFFETIQYFVNNFKSFPESIEVISGYMKIMDAVLQEYLDDLGMKRQCLTHLDFLKFSRVCEEWYQNFDNESGFFEAIRAIRKITLKKKGKNYV